MSDKTEYFNYSLCKSCGGKCCQRLAGTYLPDDFKEPITTEFILSLLHSGKFAIDWYEGNNAMYYIRPRHIHEGAICGSWGGTCINWSKESGCSLQENERPYQCRKLIPEIYEGDYSCITLPKDKATKRDMAYSWEPYQSIINEAMNQYKTP